MTSRWLYRVLLTQLFQSNVFIYLDQICIMETVEIAICHIFTKEPFIHVGAPTLPPLWAATSVISD